MSFYSFLSRVSRGDWLGNPANFRGACYCYGFEWSRGLDPAQSQHYSLFQSKRACTKTWNVGMPERRNTKTRSTKLLKLGTHEK